MIFYQRSILTKNDAYLLASQETYTFRIMPEAGNFCDYVQVLIRNLK